MSTQPPDILAGLNDAQAEAVIATEGPLLIAATFGKALHKTATEGVVVNNLQG